MEKLVVVIGMHRSGTSLVARILDLLGADLGPEDRLMEAKPDNPTGFWENLDIAGLNDDLLAQLGGRWDDPPALDPGWESDPALEPFRDRARALIDRFSGEVVAWKDPRLSITLPFWERLVPITSTLHVWRRASEVAASLERRDGMSPSTAEDLWLRYNATAFLNAPAAHHVDYAAVLEDPVSFGNAIASVAGLPPPGDEALTAIEAFTDPGLRHHRASRSGSGSLADLLYEEPRMRSILAPVLHRQWRAERAAVGLEAVRAEAALHLDNVRNARQQIEHLIAERDAALRAAESAREDTAAAWEAVERLRAEHARLEAKHAELIARHDHSQTEWARLEQRLQGTGKELQDVRAAMDALEAEADRLRRWRADLEKRWWYRIVRSAP